MPGLFRWDRRDGSVLVVFGGGDAGPVRRDDCGAAQNGCRGVRLNGPSRNRYQLLIKRADARVKAIWEVTRG